MATCVKFDGAPSLLEHTNGLLQDLMAHAPEITMVIDACTVEGRQERLDSLLTNLEMCEKALQVGLLACT